MSGYRLRDGLSFCRIGERHVFFDLHADRYFTLADRLGRVFARVIEMEAPDAIDLEPLLRSGLVMTVSEAARPTACAHPPTTSGGVLSPAVRGSPRVVAGALASRLIWSYRVKYRTLSENVAALARRRELLPAASSDPAPLARRVRGYSDAALIWSESGRCLATSMALMNDLIGLGYPVVLVFAVRIDPFHAHCWVEWQGMPVCADSDALRALTPIRVV